MLKFPPAKINLGLNVLFKRTDGFHELETVMVQLPYFDIIEIISSEEFEFHQSGIVVEGKIEDNLCVKAFRLLQKHYNIPNIYLHLNKIIPMGAGLGGGSADATFVIRMINDLFKLNLTIAEMQSFAAELGSDCPFFVQDVPQLAKGRGEILTPLELNLKGYYIKLINLGIHVSTKEAFSNIIFNDSKKSIVDIIKQPIETWKSDLKNDFENSVFKLYPILSTLKENLYSEGALYASMSGSGSTMFGIFKDEPQQSYENNMKVIEKILQF